MERAAHGAGAARKTPGCLIGTAATYKKNKGPAHIAPASLFY